MLGERKVAELRGRNGIRCDRPPVRNGSRSSRAAPGFGLQEPRDGGDRLDGFRDRGAGGQGVEVDEDQRGVPGVEVDLRVTPLGGMESSPPGASCHMG